MSKLRDEIVGDLDSALTEWRSLSEETQNELKNLQEYYNKRNEKSQEEVITNARGDHNERIKTYAERHMKLCGKAKAASGSLTSQVESSENAFTKMKKHGFIVAVGISVISLIVAISFGTKYSGFTQPITIVISFLIVFVATVFAFVVYLVMRTKRARKARMWRRIKSENENGSVLYKVIEEKRTCINGISDDLDSVAKGNYNTAIEAVLEDIRDYLN